jgi:UDP-N-acetylmuramyl pentapeptide synthase
MAFASLNYRLSPAVMHPAHVQDVAAALGWIADNARAQGIDRLLAIGEETAPAVEGFGGGAARFENIEAISVAAAELARPGATLLVKGSRSAQMERVVVALTGESAGRAH